MFLASRTPTGRDLILLFTGLMATVFAKCCIGKSVLPLRLYLVLGQRYRPTRQARQGLRSDNKNVRRIPDSASGPPVKGVSMSRIRNLSCAWCNFIRPAFWGHWWNRPIPGNQYLHTTWNSMTRAKIAFITTRVSWTPVRLQLRHVVRLCHGRHRKFSSYAVG